MLAGVPGCIAWAIINSGAIAPDSNKLGLYRI